jgi:hypothetical protein
LIKLTLFFHWKIYQKLSLIKKVVMRGLSWVVDPAWIAAPQRPRLMYIALGLGQRLLALSQIKRIMRQLAQTMNALRLAA